MIEDSAIMVMVRLIMVALNEIEAKIRELTPEELAGFRNWFISFDSELWDQEIARDLENDQLTSLVTQALKAHAAGKTREY